MNDHQKLYALVSKIAKLKTMEETVGKEAYETKTPCEFIDDLDAHGLALDQLIRDARRLEEELPYGGWMTAEEASTLKVGDPVKTLIGGYGGVCQDDGGEEELIYDAGETVIVLHLDSCLRQGLMITIGATNGVVNVYDKTDYDGFYPFKRL